MTKTAIIAAPATVAVPTPAVQMSKEELQAALASILAQEKATKAAQADLPRFAFLLIMDDESLVRWQGKAVDEGEAKIAAITYAESEGQTVFDMCKRPLPKPKGRNWTVTTNPDTAERLIDRVATGK